MNFNRDQLDKLLSMDDKTFAELARSIALAAGANKMKTEAILQNPEMLKKRIATITPAEAKQLVDAAGEEKSREIMEILRERGVDIGG